MTMKTLKSGLVAAALSLSGCVATLQDLRDSNRCVEYTSFGVGYNEVHVHFAPDHYSINFPEREVFMHWPSITGDTLFLPAIRISYHDFDSNGTLDAVYYLSENSLIVNEKRQTFYNESLSELRKNEVQQVWERCKNRLRR